MATPPRCSRSSHSVGDRPPRHTLEKIIHQVSAIEHRQRQQVQHAEAHADQGEKAEVVGQAELHRLAGVVGDRQRAAEVLQRGLADQHACRACAASAPTSPRCATTACDKPVDGAVAHRAPSRGGWPDDRPRCGRRVCVAVGHDGRRAPSSSSALPVALDAPAASARAVPLGAAGADQLAHARARRRPAAPSMLQHAVARAQAGLRRRRRRA